MCGICGRFNYGTGLPVDPADLRRMTNTMVHRGPDDEGYYVTGSLGLGFRRLSIIDLAGGHQPMSDKDETVWAVFNGEIYNFRELRRELEGRGHTFRTKSDTEVIIHGYKQWGIDVLNHLNGMFGLAIWDEKEKRLIIARDRMGIKLVYYRLKEGYLLFGSEIRPILASTATKLRVDPVALNLFLRYRYTPAPLTLIEGVRKLAPGTCLIADNGSEPRIERWYKFKPVPFDPMPSEKEAAEMLLELYRQAVERQLVSDVPLGLLLSGGLDSGLLLALMRRNGESWRTYTVGYGKEAFADDELADAAYTAKALSSSNTQVKIGHSAFEESLAKIIFFLEEPVASPSIVPMYHVCERARQDVKVALVGQGPDELFGGYTRHLGVFYGRYWRSLPRWFRDPLRSLFGLAPRIESIQRGLYSLEIPERIKRYQQVFSIMQGQTIDGLFVDGILPDGAGDKVLDCWSEIEPLMEHVDELGGFQMLEIRSSLPDELLMYADKLSMAHGLETRVPYLDQDIVEYVERLPANFKIRYGNRKWLHRQVCTGFLPREIIKRKKIGFASNVVDEWFRNSLVKRIEDMLLDDSSLMYEYLRPQVVRGLVERHKEGTNDNHKILFSLVVFEMWLRGQVDQGSHC